MANPLDKTPDPIDDLANAAEDLRRAKDAHASKLSALETAERLATEARFAEAAAARSVDEHRAKVVRKATAVARGAAVGVVGG